MCVLRFVPVNVPCAGKTDGFQAARSVCVCVCVCDLKLKGSSDCMALLTGHTVNYSATPSR